MSAVLSRRQLQTSLDEFAAEATKERKLRECGEVSIQQLETELDKLKSRDTRAPHGAATLAELKQEVTKLVLVFLSSSSTGLIEMISVLNQRNFWPMYRRCYCKHL